VAAAFREFLQLRFELERVLVPRGEVDVHVAEVPALLDGFGGDDGKGSGERERGEERDVLHGTGIR